MNHEMENSIEHTKQAWEGLQNRPESISTEDEQPKMFPAESLLVRLRHIRVPFIVRECAVRCNS